MHVQQTLSLLGTEMSRRETKLYKQICYTQATFAFYACESDHSTNKIPSTGVLHNFGDQDTVLDLTFQLLRQRLFLVIILFSSAW